MSDLAGDHADAEYLPLTTGGAEGMAELARSGLAFGVLVGDDGSPTQLFTAEGRAPVVAIDADAPMRRVMARDVVSLLNNDGVPGLVVVRDSRIAGILSADAVSDYIVDHPFLSFGLMGDELMHGDAPVTPLTLICSTCSTRNVVLFFVAGETPCSQDHPLTISWG